ncbi:MAG: helix-turn-helix transcriptional regulator [Clostridia bacterium]|nr:helix-turn-helix transcriptional regulator [Clostridia bacterium]
MSKFAERLKDLRNEHNLTKKDLAKELGVFTAAAIGLWESKKRVPNFDAVIIIAKYFGVTTDYLAGLED